MKIQIQKFLVAGNSQGKFLDHLSFFLDLKISFVYSYTKSLWLHCIFLTDI